jgi:preprotein translocase subunit SecA
MSISRIVRRTLGTHSHRERARAEALLSKIDKVGKALTERPDAELQERAGALREKARDGASPDSLLPECFALTREAAWRTVGMRPFDVQVLGGIALHRGNIAEMKTGEGKTLVATLPVTLNALAGRGVHVVTVNDYLAARDAEWMRPIYEFMGLTVGVVTEDMDPERDRSARQAAYGADITYVTNHELVFDYLRDNLALTADELVLGDLHYAVVDEVDFLLLDEARTPLIISGPTGDDPRRCRKARKMVKDLREGKHYKVDYRTRQASVLEPGWSALERAVGVKNLADAEHLQWQHVLHNALLAHGVYKRDVDYIVDDGKVLLVDEFTGRVSPDKRLADGLHQALEAKEGLKVRPEDRTLAKTSYQNFFRLYEKLSGMTGTAYSAREEFLRTYTLRVVRVPTHRPMIRKDWAPVVYRSAEEKFVAVKEEILELREAGRPVLVGTTSVRESEDLSRRLKKARIPHQVLNAKNHEQEASIIAQAGRPGAVTLSTNMAGRGVDILLGGNPEALPDKGAGPLGREETRRIREQAAADRERVVSAGGLAVVGTGLHEARRIDDQLRGRSGRQGDPGSSQYFLSLDDPIYQKFGRPLRFPEVLDALREQLADHPEGEPVRQRSVLSTLERLRKKVEVENEGIRKEVLKFDLVIEQQRQVIYGWRRRLLGTPVEEVEALVDELVSDVGEDLAHRHFGGGDALEREQYEDFAAEMEGRFDLDFDLAELGTEDSWSPIACADLAQRRLQETLAELRQGVPRELRLEAARQLLLSTIDELWTDHLTVLERVDEAIGLRVYAEIDPLVEFRREAGLLFQDMLREVRLSTGAALLDFLRALAEADPETLRALEGREADAEELDALLYEPQPDLDADEGTGEPEETPAGRVLLPSATRPVRRTLKR